jgi:hypothetical protein
MTPHLDFYMSHGWKPADQEIWSLHTDRIALVYAWSIPTLEYIEIFMDQDRSWWRVNRELLGGKTRRMTRMQKNSLTGIGDLEGACSVLVINVAI